jgi:DNA mismatch endonuclease (patch repair protein)
MQGTRRRDTAPELALRRELHRRGMRYRVDAQVLPGLRRRADVVFTKARVAVYVDGCFWHGCPFHATTPKANASFWADKLAANKARDRDTDTRLASADWQVIRVWAHEDPARASERIADVVRSARQSGRRGHGAGNARETRGKDGSGG